MFVARLLLRCGTQRQTVMQLALNVLPELWTVCNHKCQSELCLRQFQLIHRIPRTADVPCRLGYVFALSFFLAETL